MSREAGEAREAREAGLSVAMVGDVLLGTSYPKWQVPADSGRLLFSDCAAVLQSADLALGNLEGPLSQLTEAKKKSSYVFQQPPFLAPRLREAGFDFLCIGNNHLMDMGREGCRQTCVLLDSLGISYTGISGQDPVVLEVELGVRNQESGKIRVGICSFGQNSYTPHHTDTAQVRRVVTALRARCDILIVSFHGGAEGSAYRHVPDGMEYYLHEKRGCLRLFAHLAIDCGADLVHGHGPHVPRALELYKDRLIAYSLGNFCTPYGISLQGVCGLAPLLLVNLDKEGRFVDGQIYSYRQYHGRGPVPDSTQTAAREIRQLSQSDFPQSRLSIEDNGHIKRR